MSKQELQKEIDQANLDIYATNQRISKLQEELAEEDLEEFEYVNHPKVIGCRGFKAEIRDNEGELQIMLNCQTVYFPIKGIEEIWYKLGQMIMALKKKQS